MLIAAVRAYDPFPADGHRARITIGRTVWRRETWRIPPAQGPARPQGAASWARGLGLPRRVFVLSPGELKPIYVDFDSPSSPASSAASSAAPAPAPRPAGAVHRDAPRA